ncbi:MAG: YlxM family DNA-binding protein [Candidatus Dormibacteraceae bacterium]
MLLDTLQSRELQVELFERYGTLLTEHQRQVLELYLRGDWSLSEIAQSQNNSRSAVHDVVRRSLHLLNGYEEKLEWGSRRAELKQELNDLQTRVEELTAKVDKL